MLGFMFLLIDTNIQNDSDQCIDLLRTWRYFGFMFLLIDTNTRLMGLLCAPCDSQMCHTSKLGTESESAIKKEQEI